MGNNNCKNSEGGYMIHLDKPYYYPGEIVHGKIYSHFIKNFESSSVEFEIKGEEYTCVNHKKTSKKNNNGTYIKKRESSNILYNETHLLFKPENNIINQGHYVYPFTFKLPLNLLGTFEYYDKDIKAYIKYILEVRAIPLNGSSAIKNQVMLIIRQPPYSYGYTSKMSDKKLIKTCCCLSKGDSNISVSFEKNYYCIEDRVNVVCEFDSSKCSVSLNSISLNLWQMIIVKDNKRKCEKIIHRELSKNPFMTNNIAGEENSRTFEIHLRDQSNPCKSYKDNCAHKDLFKDANLIPSLQASVDSNLIKYSLMCSTPSPYLEIPLIIYVPDIRSNIQIFQPSNWSPIIGQTIDFSFSSSDEGKKTEGFNLSDYNPGSDNLYQSPSDAQKLDFSNTKTELITQRSNEKLSNGSNIKIINECKESAENEILLKIKPFLVEKREASC